MAKDKLERRVLIGIGSDETSFRTVNYVARMFAEVPNFAVTLIHILPPLPEVLKKEDSQLEINDYRYKKQLEARYHNRLKEIWDKAQSVFLRYSWSQKRLETTFASRHFNLGPELLFWAEQGYYDALVVGWRRQGFFERLFSQTAIAEQLLTYPKSLPLWLVFNATVGNKEIILVLDNSAASRRVIDHVGFILEGCQEIQLTMSFLDDSENVSGQMLTTLTKSGIPSESIKVKKMVEGELKELSPAALVLAQDTLPLKRLKSLTHDFKGGAIWLVP